MEARPRLEWTLAEAEAADAHYRDAHPECSDADPATPLFQWLALRTIEERDRSAIEAGDGFALLGAIRTCANHDIVMPEWLARAFIQRYDQVLACKLNSWDDAFGRPYPQGKQLQRLREQRELKLSVWVEVQRILKREPETAIDAELFERVGKKFHMSKTRADKYYYLAVKLMGPARRLGG